MGQPQAFRPSIAAPVSLRHNTDQMRWRTWSQTVKHRPSLRCLETLQQFNRHLIQLVFLQPCCNRNKLPMLTHTFACTCISHQLGDVLYQLSPDLLLSM